MSTPAKRRGRPTGNNTPLTADRVLHAALELVDADGLAALSMRRLAHELGVDPMSIYHHLPNKAAVVSGIVELVFTRMELPATDGSPWTDQIRAWVHAYHDVARQHPNLVLQIVTDPVAATQAAALIDTPLRMALQAGGVPADKIRAAAGMFVDYVNGYALAAGGLPDRDPRDAPAHPGLEIGLDIMLLGLDALAAAHEPTLDNTSQPTDDRRVPTTD